MLGLLVLLLSGPLLQPAPAVSETAKPKRAKRKTKREADPAGEGSSTSGSER